MAPELVLSGNEQENRSPTLEPDRVKGMETLIARSSSMIATLPFRAAYGSCDTDSGPSQLTPSTRRPPNCELHGYFLQRALKSTPEVRAHSGRTAIRDFRYGNDPVTPECAWRDALWRLRSMFRLSLDRSPSQVPRGRISNHSTCDGR